MSQAIASRFIPTNILLPVDFSLSSDAALTMASQLIEIDNEIEERGAWRSDYRKDD
jgi:hypothetical protein